MVRWPCAQVPRRVKAICSRYVHPLDGTHGGFGRAASWAWVDEEPGTSGALSEATVRATVGRAGLLRLAGKF